MRASPDFKFWTQEEAAQLLGLKEGFACWAHLCHEQPYKTRMAKAGRSRAYLYLVEAEVAEHRFHKVGLTFSSNPRERDPAAYRKVLASVPVSWHQADAFESAAISWLRMKFKPKPLPVKVWHWAGASEIINTTNKSVIQEFNALVQRCNDFCADTKPIWILKDNLLIAEIWASILTPYFVSSSSPIFNRHREEIAEALGLTTPEAVAKYKAQDQRRSAASHAAYKKLNP